MSKKMTYDEWVEKCVEKHVNTYIYNEETKNHFNGSHSIVPIICKTHGVFWKEARRHCNEGYGCPLCAIEYRAKNNTMTFDEFVSKARTVHGDKYVYFEYNGAKTPIPITCPEHGIFMQTPNDHLSGKGCPLCKESHLEREIRVRLNELKIKYEYRKHFNWLGKKEIDFYLPDSNIGIECQGKQHFGIGGWFKHNSYDEVLKSDEIKNNLVRDNGIELIYYIDKKVSKERYPEFYNSNRLFVNLDDIIGYILNKG